MFAFPPGSYRRDAAGHEGSGAFARSGPASGGALYPATRVQDPVYPRAHTPGSFRGAAASCEGLRLDRPGTTSTCPDQESFDVGGERDPAETESRSGKGAVPDRAPSPTLHCGGETWVDRRPPGQSPPTPRISTGLSAKRPTDGARLSAGAKAAGRRLEPGNDFRLGETMESARGIPVSGARDGMDPGRVIQRAAGASRAPGR